MKRETFIKQMEKRGYRIAFVEDGLDVYDQYGWRAFLSDKIRLGLNTCSLELPNDDYNLINRYIRTPLEKR